MVLLTLCGRILSAIFLLLALQRWRAREKGGRERERKTETERVNVCAGTGFYVVLVDLFLMHIHPIAVEIEQ